MTTVERQNAVADAAATVREAPVDDLATTRCKVCHKSFWPEGFHPTYDELQKVRSWTVAQLVSVMELAERSGDIHKFLEGVGEVARPGIGAMFNPTVLGANVNGIFVGIEPDGYTHS